MKKIWTILILALLLRLFLVLSTYHPDMEAFNLGGKVVASGNILNLYDYSSNLASFNYPPPIYWFHGIFHLLLGSILGVGLLVKLPYLIFDLLIGFLLLRWFESKRLSLGAFTLWMFNPVSLYATYMMGQFDIIPTFFTVLSIYFITKEKLSWAALALGGGIAFKLYPIFLIFPLIILGKTFWDKFKLGMLAVLPYILTVMPYLGSSSFRTTALFTNQSSKSLYSAIPVSGGESILLFPTALLVFYFVIWRKKMDKLSFWQIYAIPLLLFFIFTHFHPQWLIWVTPFFIIDLISSQFKNIWVILLILGSFTSSLFFFDPSLTLGLFSPLVPILHNAPGIWTMLHLDLDFNFLRSILQTIFVSAALYLIYSYFQKEQHEI